MIRDYPPAVANFIRFSHGRDPYLTERSARVAIGAKLYKHHHVVGRAQALREGVKSGKVVVLASLRAGPPFVGMPEVI